MSETLAAGRAQGWLGRHWQKLVATTIWLALAGSFLAYSVIAGRSPTETVGDLLGLLRTPLGPLLYILIYTLRPLAFFSAIVVTLLGGAIWGPVWGMLFVVIGSNMSATLAYGFGRALGQGLLPEGEGGFVSRYAGRLRQNAFGTILVMRLIYLPYDLVNYLAGFLRVPYRPYILASVLGSLPGTLTFVLAGASLNIEDILAGRFSISAINPWTLALSAVLFVGGIVVSKVLQQREG
ncbi:VTT domain-containing protein [Oscillochloris sp. ZM17-4]|uniref:TVP38/TMEM64 family protein n=1 Tax=Oscillochloris sp. ZM17-4 TaxID=2866714 RepID=UPI001C732DE3|nr:VTT domain-containing protein [Oscillochloris sp. ZM17-4]MBX0331299.1 VTT domain-containing protein [Oscillochloris sp. ZM17-4]